MTRYAKATWVIVVCALFAIIGGVTLAGPEARQIAERAATEIAMPCSLIWMGLVVLTLLLARRGQRVAAALSLSLLALHSLGTSPMCATILMWTLEQEFADVRPLLQEEFDAIIVLGGGTNEGRNGEPQANPSGDRVMLAARMYHAGLANEIYCTGQRNKLTEHDRLDPSEEAMILLSSLGIPDDRLKRVDGRNTSHEMQLIANELGADARVGIITSAWHMKRAQRLASSQGLDLVPLPADFRTPPVIRLTPLDLIPSASACPEIRNALKEYMASLVGR